MKSYFIVSAVGRDRPGFVHRITGPIGALGGNIELQRSVRMAGEYAALFLVSVSEGAAQRSQVEQKLIHLAGDDLTLSVRDAVAGDEHRSSGARLMDLIASGADHPGIIDAVTQVLFTNQINIESMDYDTDSAPMTGDTLFRMRVAAAVPADVDLDAVHDELRVLEGELNLDILFRPAG